MGVQVQELTQNLMPWGKEYIDFSFAGRHISEFGLVAVTNSDRYQFAGSPEFEDETSNVNGVWGQYYWGTNFKTKTYSYSLVTDGMTERQLEDFKYHFRPGHYGQFYEDTWFDRYCYVRIKAVIDFTFIPFQEEVKVAGVNFPSRIYKGECKIQFIQDRPFTYSFYQVLDTKIADLQTMNDNGKAAVRMMYHSNIPAIDSWKKEEKCSTGSNISLPGVKKVIVQNENKNEIQYLEQEDNSIVFNNVSFFPYYNPSTTASEAILSFQIKRRISPVDAGEWQPVYFNEIYDEFTNPKTPYNTISTTDKIQMKNNILNKNKYYINSCKYGLPEISYNINKAINIAWNFYQDNIRGSLSDLQELLQEEIINIRVLSWAIKILQKMQTNQVFYRSEFSQEETGYGILIDEDLTVKEQEPIEQASEELIGEIIFHSGDYEEEKYNEEKDVQGCFRPNKVEVCPYPIYDYNIYVDWFGYFNIMMLMIFAECKPYENGDIIECKDLEDRIFSNFYPYTLKFDGETGQVFSSYKINYIDSNGIINQEEVLEENCSNIMASNYLLIDGGDTLDIATGEIASYHIISFKHGDTEPIAFENVRLEYKYTYV